MARRLNYGVGSLPFVYLGLLVGASMFRITHWTSIIDKLWEKLSRWKASTLSYDGGVTLL